MSGMVFSSNNGFVQSNFTVNNNVTPQLVTGLAFPIGDTNLTTSFRAVLFCTTAGGSGYRVGVDTTNITVAASICNIVALTTGSVIQQQQIALPGNFGFASAASPILIYMDGIIQATTTIHNYDFASITFAQNTASGSNSQVLQGSYVWASSF